MGGLLMRVTSQQGLQTISLTQQDASAQLTCQLALQGHHASLTSCLTWQTSSGLMQKAIKEDVLPMSYLMAKLRHPAAGGHGGHTRVSTSTPTIVTSRLAKLRILIQLLLPFRY